MRRLEMTQSPEPQRPSVLSHNYWIPAFALAGSGGQVGWGA